MESTNANMLCKNLIEGLKKGELINHLRVALYTISESQFTSRIFDDDTKKAFWINTYNANFILLKKEQPNSKIFKLKEVRIALDFYSLDDIEHGILRRSKFKFGLGYIPNPFTNDKVQMREVDKLDYRIHFALNCGVHSCPPIRSYSHERINEQLDIATQSFLESETDFYPNKNEVHLSRLFKWYYGDFGGRKGINEIISKYLKLDISDYKLVFKKYSRQEHLNNFI